MIHLDAATIFVAWAAGCLVWKVDVNRRHDVVFGVAWVFRVFALLVATCGLIAAVVMRGPITMLVGSAVVAVITAVALAWSIVDHRRLLAVTTGPDRPVDAVTPTADRLDVLAGAVALYTVFIGALHAGGPTGLALARYLIAVASLGGLTFTMVFGHRMLAKPHLGRGPLEVATTALMVVWPFEVGVMLWPTGMVSVFTGAVDDGFAGILGWMWVTFAASTLVLVIVARIILADREHAKAASATGMLYLSGLTGFTAVFISRAVLSG